MVDIHGSVEPGFEGVRDAFEENFRQRHEVGAAVCVYVGGRPVVDLWAGLADSRAGRPWERDTLQLVFSATKGVAAAVVHHLAQQGRIDLDAPVASYWPEFAANGKAEVPVRWLLSHQAGLAAVDRPLTHEEQLDGHSAADALAAQAPAWEPGTAHGYHAVTYGDLVGEVVRRATGRSIGTVLREEVAGPLGLDLWIGLPPEEEHRVAPLIPATAVPSEAPDETTAKMLDPSTYMHRVFMNPPLRVSHLNRPELHAAEQAAMNGITTARALAKLYAACVSDVDGARLLSPATLDAARSEQVHGVDRVTEREMRFGTGFALPTALNPMLGPDSFGHAGRGGSLGCGEAGRGVGFGYVMNQMQGHLQGDPRPRALCTAVRAALG